jgi:hypothetical protein
MTIYQCPDCLGVHEAATEPVVGIFVRCEDCLLQAYLDATAPMAAEPIEDELAAPWAA